MSRFSVLLPLFLWVAPLSAAEPVTELAGLLAAAKSVEAQFEQTVTGANGMVSQQSTGVMSVARPQLFRWDVKTPFEQLIVADGKQVWVYDPDLAQAVVRPFDRQLADTPALLFSGDAKKIGERYGIELGDSSATVRRFVLKPHDRDALFESLLVTFRDGRLAEMTLADPLGQKTRIVFSGVTLNGRVTESRFRFVPPEGTDVIREGF
ncbi:MAG: outer membrane lipoprotein chaperone LolA [Pseudomonadota bacterium]